MDNNFRKIYHIPSVRQFSRAYFPFGLGETFDVFPNYLTYLSKSCGTLANCIGKKTTFLVGNGFEDNFEKQVINKKGQTVSKLLKISARDLVQYGGFAWLVSYNAFGQVSEIDRLEFDLVRVVETKDIYCNPTQYALLPYERYQTKKVNYVAQFFDAFDPNNVKEGFDKETGKAVAKPQILYCPIDLIPGNQYYPFPCYHAVIKDIESEMALSEVRETAIKEGFKTQTLITLYGTNSPTPEQQQRDSEIFSQGIGASGKNTALFHATSHETKPTIESVPMVDISRTFEVAENIVERKIRQSFDTPEEFFSFTGKSDFLGDSDKMTKLLDFYQKTALNDYQKAISCEFEKVFKYWHNQTILPQEFKIENLSLNQIPLNAPTNNPTGF